MELEGQQLRLEQPFKEMPEVQDAKPCRVLPFAFFGNAAPPAAYGECMRNHAAALGLHAVDGCLEFMPSLESTLACAACGCHRNFHRRSPSPAAPAAAANEGGAVRKRFRTQFSADQKKRMREVCERLGWRVQKKDKEVVEECCTELGLSRVVFKGWMHNHRPSFTAGPCSAIAGAPHSQEASSCKDAPPSTL